jgi:phosphatidate cytidylyltransferase
MTAQRIVTGVILIIAVVVLLFLGSPALLTLALALVLGLALWEFFCLGDVLGLRAYRGWTMFCMLALLYSQWSAGQIEAQSLVGGELLRNPGVWVLPMDAVFLLFAVGLGFIGLFQRGPLADALPRAGSSAAGLLLVVFPTSYAIRIYEIPQTGAQWVLFLLVIVWVGDTVALVVGRAMGRLKMAPMISPKKTWEGAAGSFLSSLLVGAIFSHWLNTYMLVLVLVAALTNIAAQAGDLIESSWKRGAQVKDSGAILPGHGGMLDRIDSLIFATPVIWCYVELFGRARV